MTKTIDTLVEDIYAVVNDRGGWDSTITEFFTNEMQDIATRRLQEDEEERTGNLRMSSMGTPCVRKLWYNVNTPNEGLPLPPPVRLKFLYGDMLEALLLSLAMAAGHNVRGMQDVLSIADIKGHRDAVIDNITLDVKSASPYSFDKFKNGALRDNDAFGYISQLSSYVFAGHREDPTVHPSIGAFLVINKVSGELVLDKYEFGPEILRKEEEFENIKTIVAKPNAPERGFGTVPDGYKKDGKLVTNGNEKLGINCSYCEFKDKCWPNLRTFMYKKGQGYEPAFFTKVVKTPKVMEV